MRIVLLFAALVISAAANAQMVTATTITGPWTITYEGDSSFSITTLGFNGSLRALATIAGKECQIAGDSATGDVTLSGDCDGITIKHDD